MDAVAVDALSVVVTIPLHDASCLSCCADQQVKQGGGCRTSVKRSQRAPLHWLHHSASVTEWPCMQTQYQGTAQTKMPAGGAVQC